jgi:phage-related protein
LILKKTVRAHEITYPLYVRPINKLATILSDLPAQRTTEAEVPYASTCLLYLYRYNVKMEQIIKNLFWVGSAKKDLKAMPDDVQDTFGYALHRAQSGEKHKHAKPLTGFGSAGVLEVVEDADSGTFRAVYTVKFGGAVYVLHCFQKKSKRGITTPKPDMDIIRERLKAAEAHAKGELTGQN